MVPNGWDLACFESLKISIIDGDRGINYPKKEDYLTDGYALFLGADNIENGLLNIEKTIYISKEKHNSMRKGVVQESDIILVMRGNGTGRSCIYTNKVESHAARINSGLIIIRVHQDYSNVHFLQQLLLSPVIQKQFESFMFGSAQPQLTVRLLKSLRFACPPPLEQKKISQILTTWDQAIATTERLLDLARQQKKALMQQLLTGKKRLADKSGVKFQSEWHRTELGELLDYKQPTPYLVDSTEYRDEYKIPVLTAGKTFILGYTDETSGIYQEDLPAIIFDDFTTDSKFVDFPFKAKSSAMKILVAKKGVSIKYVFEAMQMLNFAVGGHQRHWISIFSNLVVPIPSKEEQEKIATVLSAADQEIDTLLSQLNGLKQEKKALMQTLLTGKRRVSLENTERTPC
ncbi:restriction endonuclease subunit S [Undibacterium sp. CY7W]|uniref:Restriction endonuclease subunit S n=1 Tax=Undibacterium rugosum TaxID=2762291 RepID=A0A923HZK1_9BURK|nr:restriction endonuclease subunit S [Undibacterium rugosum]MBC3933732.1 restriction endonuclease subunit S [Undibacterium rugosum]